MLNTEAKNLYLNVVKNSNSILDIGANVGQSFVEYKDINPKVSVLSIEANENCAKDLKSVGANFIIAALGDDSNDLDFYINKNESMCQGASFFREQTNFYADENVTIKKIKTQPLDAIVGNASFDFIKIDTQGSELPIIKGGRNTIKKAKWILVETPVIEYNKGSASYNEIKDELLSLGFTEMMVIRENMFGETIVQRDILFKNSLMEYDLTNPINTILIGGKYEAILECYNKEKPDTYVEIGCYRLNTSINLLRSHMPKNTYLLDLFEKAPAFETPPEIPPLSLSEASELISNTFGDGNNINLIKGFTCVNLPHIIQEINGQNNNTFIFVDGGHSYTSVIRDLINISTIKNKLTVVIDDADWTEIDVAIKDFMKICHYRNPVIEYLKPNLCVINLSII